MPSHGGVSQAFQDMAGILETLETTETDLEITSATPVDDELLETETVSLEVCVTVPFLDGELSDTTTLRPEAVSLQDDGRLDVEFQATVDGPQATESLDSDSTGQLQAGGESNPKPNATATAAEDEFRTDCVSASKTETQLTKATDEDNADDDSGSNSGDVTTEEDRPAYRDPEQLREVYETYETFAEMTDALNVDVTAQTVRRYMIEYDIHQPASHTGSQSAETLLEADPDSLSSLESDQTCVPSDSPEASASTNHATPQPTNSTDEEPTTPSTTGENETSPLDSRSADLESHSSASSEESQKENTAQNPDNPGSDTEAIATDGGEQTESNASTDSEDDCPSDITLDDQAIAETVALPSHLTLNEVKTAVRDAKTLYEAQQELELDRECTRSLLETLDLLELVHGRLATRDRYDQTITEINRRILAATG